MTSPLAPSSTPEPSEPSRHISRRTLLRRGAVVGAGAAGATTIVRFGVGGASILAQDAGTATPETGAATAVAGSTADRIQQITDAGTAFLATLTDDEKPAVLFDWSDTEQKQRWSNFPEGLFSRDGLMWGDISEEAQNAWLSLMQATLSERGYQRVLEEWAADEALAAEQGGGGTGGAPSASGTPATGQGNGGPGGQDGMNGTPPADGSSGPGGNGGPNGMNGTPPAGGNGGPGGNGGGGGQMLGKQYYWVALIGTPSTTDPWQWQWGGHHVTVNATVGNGNVALTPSFIGVQPATYTDDAGNEIRPLGDIEDDAFALVNALDAEQQSAAILGDTYIDLVLGPGQDGKTLQPEGLPASQLTDDQTTMLVGLIDYYTGLLNDDLAAARLKEVTDVLDDTYFVWYGPTTQGSAAYFRVAGPTIVIEFSPQGGMGASAADHIHGIYRDPSNDYGAKYLA
ncbi:MAG: DUF3500 domain-containing protein [Thermomicrobiales bacterium]